LILICYTAVEPICYFGKTNGMMEAIMLTAEMGFSFPDKSDP
jgi:hypothetical protein